MALDVLLLLIGQRGRDGWRRDDWLRGGEGGGLRGVVRRWTPCLPGPGRGIVGASLPSVRFPTFPDSGEGAGSTGAGAAAFNDDAAAFTETDKNGKLPTERSLPR